MTTACEQQRNSLLGLGIQTHRGGNRVAEIQKFADKLLSTEKQEQPEQVDDKGRPDGPLRPLGRENDPNQAPPNNETHQSRPKEGSLLNNLWHNYQVWKFLADPRVWLEVIALGVLIGYTHYAGQQRDEMVRANKINADALRSVQRAFINFKGVESRVVTAMGGVQVPGLGETKHGFEFSGNYENSGTTPAMGVLTYFAIDEIPDGKTAAFKFQPPKGTPWLHSVIGPKSLASSGGVFKPEDFWTPIRNKTSIYFWGWKLYRDVFPGTPPHVTEFCSNLVGVFRTVPVGARTATTGSPYSFQFGDCDGRHNCSDDDCEDYAMLELLYETHQASTPPITKAK